MDLKDKLRLMLLQQKPKEPIYLEYLEGDGGQYIDTLLKVNQDTTIVGTALINSYDGFLYGSRDNFDFLLVIKANGSGWFGAGKGSDVVYHNISLNEKFTFQGSNKNGFLMNGTTIIRPKPGELNAQRNLTLFGLNAGAGVERRFVGRIYSCQLYDNDKLIRNFRPCLNPYTLRPAMYDTVNKKYYYNQGLGEFKYELTFTKLDYIKADGHQGINLELAPVTEIGMEGVFRITTLDNKRRGIFGSRDAAANNSCFAVISNNDIVADYWSYNTSRITARVPLNDKVKISLNRYNREIVNLDKGIILAKDDTFIAEEFTSNAVPCTLMSHTAFATDDFIGDCYEFKCYVNNILVRDMIPARFNNGEVGMYDFIESKFYKSAYRQAFRGYIGDHEVGQSIQGTGTQFIDTALLVNPKRTFANIGLSLTSFSMISALFGARGRTTSDLSQSNVIFREGDEILRLDWSGEQTKINKPLNKMLYFNCKDNMVKVNNEVYTSDIVKPDILLDEGATFALFRITRHTGLSNMKLYFAIIGLDDTPQVVLVPARKGSFIGMIDVLTGKEYPNAGTGNFIFNE